ncbi:MAG: DinB family protein [Terriglobales bacterium]
MRTLELLVCLMATAAIALAQDKPAAAPSSQPPPKTAAPAPPENPYSAFNKRAYGYIKDVLLRSAEKMPEENYSFKPSDTVRSFGQLLGHVADSQYYFCSAALGEKNPALKIEQTKSSKADLIAALKEVFAYCDKGYDSMTDAVGTQRVKVFADDNVAKLNVLTINNMHTIEHYGNLITYLRLKNIVPPSSEPKPQAEQKK